MGYMPALDGLRAIAVIAVILFHAGVGWAGGGFLGVEVFFVLSGFLITSLLSTELRATSSIALTHFWARRARRLLPALFVVIAVVGIYQTIAGPTKSVPDLLASGLGALFYVGNWQQLIAGSTYFGATGPVSPLQHTWSLAIEEQFYLIWPLIVLAVLWIAKRVRPTDHDPRRPLRILLFVSLAGALASAADMALLVGPDGINRVYLGTDTRAQALLVGCSLALALALRPVRTPERRWRRSAYPRVSRAIIAVLAVAGTVALIWSLTALSSDSNGLYRFGLLGFDVCVASIILGVTALPDSLLGRAFAIPPLRAIGTISYGLYLWHFPLFLWLTQDSTGLSGVALFVVRVGVTFAVATVSFFLIEQPIRRQRLPRWSVRTLAPVGAALAAASLVAATNAAAVTFVPPKPPTLTTVPGVPASATSAPPCDVVATDTANAIVVPPPPSQIPANVIPVPAGYSGSASLTFPNCPPTRVLVIGDSLAATLGVGLMQDEERYNTEIFLDPLPGCGFGLPSEYDLTQSTGWTALPPECTTEIQYWRQEELAVGAQAVVVQLGWRDAFDVKIGGRIEHLGEAAYDAYIGQRMALLLSTLGQGGIPVELLSIADAGVTNPDGSLAAVASAGRHTEINALLASAASAATGRVEVEDLDSIVSPQGHYSSFVDGQQCRFSDDLHFTVFCGELAQPSILSLTMRMLSAARPRI
jgi:peptidoglycan/LPS O-acetylase OafA/YrhL